MQIAANISLPLPPHVSGKLSGTRVLIVDDNAATTHALVALATRWEMQCHVASSATEAIAYVENDKDFDVALLDMHMPGTDGVTLVSELREHSRTKTLPIVLLTSVDSDPNASPTISTAVYLRKPVKPAELFETLSQIGTGTSARMYSPVNEHWDPTMGVRQPLRIVIAEDNHVNQMVLQGMLKRCGYRADVTANGTEVLAALSRQEYDLVLMDVQMPEMDGEEATRRIRATLTAERQPYIIAITANAFEDQRQQYLDVGMDDYVSKPIAPLKLIDALERCWNRVQSKRIA